MVMSSHGVYASQTQETDAEMLVPVQDQPFPEEKQFEELVARHPKLLAGNGTSPIPSSLLLITRQMGIPEREGGTDRWSLDLLLVDSEAVPTLVEIKRRDDIRLKTNLVVGQTLGYAAHAENLTGSALHDRYIATCRQQGMAEEDADENLRAFVGEEQASTDDGSDRQVTTFWQQVDTNLKAGRIRILFVADEIPVVAISRIHCMSRTKHDQ